MWARLCEVVPDRSGILPGDDTGVPKQGTHSVGVKRQYGGAQGKTANCHVAVTTALMGPTLVWPTSGELSLPRDWADDPERRETVRVPARVRFREKRRIALAHVHAVRKAGFALEAVWVWITSRGGRIRAGRITRC